LEELIKYCIVLYCIVFAVLVKFPPSSCTLGEVIADNGGNFVGADKELSELVKKLDEDKIQGSVANQGIKWHFNPPLAPHFGGYMES